MKHSVWTVLQVFYSKDSGFSDEGVQINSCNICFIAWKLHTFTAFFVSLKLYFLPICKASLKNEKSDTSFPFLELL